MFNKHSIILLLFVIVKFVLQYLLIHNSFDLHRDEYLHLGQAKQLAWGFDSVPPFTFLLSYIILFYNTKIKNLIPLKGIYDTGPGAPTGAALVQVCIIKSPGGNPWAREKGPVFTTYWIPGTHNALFFGRDQRSEQGKAIFPINGKRCIWWTIWGGKFSETLAWSGYVVWHVDGECIAKHSNYAGGIFLQDIFG